MTPIQDAEVQMRTFTAFDDVPDDELKDLLSDAELRHLVPGEILIVEGEDAEVAYLILDGEVEVLRSAGDGEVVVAQRHAGEFVGEMALLMETQRSATVRAQSTVTVVEITAAKFQSVLASRPETAISMLRTSWGRLQAAEAHLVQHQKMAALGTLAAGLAHELNNPTSAMVRSAHQLSEAIASWEQFANSLGELPMSPAECEVVDALRENLCPVAPFAQLDPLDRADLEESIQYWLEKYEIDQPWVLSSLLAETDMSVARLDEIASTIERQHLGILLWWYGNGALVHRLLRELTLSGRAVSEIVTAVKAYTRLDQAPIQDIAIHEGIDQALVILRHKLKGIQVVREYGENLPKITAYAGEINQVWTNLIDNAADAMNGSGRLTIRTCLDNDDIVVEIEDSGPGISRADQECIFNPFFTTKQPGKGSGLGLAITFNIIRRHGGDIRLESEPNRTCFSVHLPIDTGIE